MTAKAYKLFCLLLASSLLLACGSDKDRTELKEDLSAREGDSLIALYTAEVRDAPAERKAELYERAAEVGVRISAPQRAASFLQKAIIYGKDDRDNFLALIELFENDLDDPQVNDFLKAGFAEKYPKHERSADFAKEVNPEGNSMEQIIAARFEKAYPSEGGPPDRAEARHFVDASEVYAMYFPDRPDAPEKLYKAAESARLLNSYQKAIQLYDWIIEHYPDYDHTPQALFLKAFTYDDNLSRYEIAAELYQQFMREYPQHEFADDAQFLLENMGKSDEEILQSLQQDQ